MKTAENGIEVLHVQLYDGKNEIPSDGTTRALLTIDYAHHEIHCGDHYFVREHMDIPSSSARQYIIATPNTVRWAHTVISVLNELETEYILTEGVSTGSDGTPITPRNRNRNATDSATVVVTHTPVGVTGGTVIATARLGSGRNFGGEVRDTNEIMLKQNTKYHFRINNVVVSASNLANVLFDWYEHTDL